MNTTPRIRPLMQTREIEFKIYPRNDRTWVGLMYYDNGRETKRVDDIVAKTLDEVLAWCRNA